MALSVLGVCVIVLGVNYEYTWQFLSVTLCQFSM
jgi:hypothetical protein